MNVREKSIIKSINADVAIKTLFSKLNEAIVKPRIAPLVPNRPAEKPEKEPPIKAFLLFGAKDSEVKKNIIFILFIRNFLKIRQKSDENLFIYGE
ncbi:MAG: hypothetical protein O3C56_02610 [Bacteroidetes bacterium]|nr:hypothetical protein [Bacteroidota bacterium]